ncbi:MAG TPA: winged helix-turn-helix domain-containing protein [Dictyoglomaceae bacterium]|nr:winged helix-turn-helix domain-containing protein [Dictyoglomaceae bacterium]HOL39846.1 winged helix-turn-helix domain-containing protein [Dictyoglomaceae bacterium]HOP95704.1 winged helix-turn-helix domain-containing protein [Dictyoglomaceae bacterium]HPP16324.1 winged helix-turn-helix domain-containing protein [Dictyoglomaceae bacterium]HPU44020.1 winged helix-turn-helix domain-containing protein [Dictyoglomaceae bacterium]
MYDKKLLDELFGDTEDEICSLFEKLIEKIDSKIKDVNNIGAEAFEKGRYDEVEKTREQAVKLEEIKNKVISLKNELTDLAGKIEDSPKNQKEFESPRKLRRGECTPKTSYYIPILKALVEMGGRGRVYEVLDRVFEIMEPTLKPIDLELLPRNGGLRWRNAAQWARVDMVKEGLLKSDSPYGIWEITDKGREMLKNR